MNYQLTITWLHIIVAMYFIINIFIIGLMMGINDISVRSWKDLFAFTVTTLIYFLAGILFVIWQDLLMNIVFPAISDWLGKNTLIKFYFMLWQGKFDKLSADQLYTNNYRAEKLKEKKKLTHEDKLIIKATEIINKRNNYKYQGI